MRLFFLKTSLNILFILFRFTAFPFFFDTIMAHLSLIYLFLIKKTLKESVVHFSPDLIKNDISFLLEII